ncbi:hypothetical protein K8I61_15435 [bacterium]|nr:hypothetical protein [bacterium]
MKQTFVILFVLTLVSLFTGGCVIKDRHGAEVFRVGDDAPTSRDVVDPTPTPAPAPAQAEAAPDETASPEDEDAAQDARTSALFAVRDAREANEESGDAIISRDLGGESMPGREDTTRAPWWVVEPAESDAKPVANPEEGAIDEASAGEPEEDPFAPVEPEPAEEDPAPREPIRRVVSVDKTLQPISPELWESAYRGATAKGQPSAKRASMEQVKAGIDAGYGATYVSKLERAISLDRKNGYAYYFLGRGRFEKGDWPGAREFGMKAAQMLDNDPPFRAAARVLLAKSLANQGKVDEAAEQIRAALEDDPGNTEARLLALRYR